MEHVPAYCSISHCQDEASYWIDTSNGFTEALLPSLTVPETFYLCSNHMTLIVNDEDGNYHHLRIDTGEVEVVEIAGYSCHEECEVCHS
jgi:hypothetical protein